MPFVRVGTGPFLMGTDPDRDSRAQANEKPQHSVLLDAFDIAKFPVTNAQWAVYVAASGGRFDTPRDKAAYPVINVSWDDVTGFCTWLSRVTDKDIRLPTEAEWEKAARGPDGAIYPWGKLESE